MVLSAEAVALLGCVQVVVAVQAMLSADGLFSLQQDEIIWTLPLLRVGLNAFCMDRRSLQQAGACGMLGQPGGLGSWA